MKKTNLNRLIHGIDCTKSLKVSGIYANDKGVLYLEMDGGVEVPLQKLLQQFEENMITLHITTQEEVVV